MATIFKVVLGSKYFWMGLVAYALCGVLMAWELSLHDCDYAVLRGIVWPIPFIRFLCGADL